MIARKRIKKNTAAKRLPLSLAPSPDEGRRVKRRGGARRGGGPPERRALGRGPQSPSADCHGAPARRNEAPDNDAEQSMVEVIQCIFEPLAPKAQSKMHMLPPAAAAT